MPEAMQGELCPGPWTKYSLVQAHHIHNAGLKPALTVENLRTKAIINNGKSNNNCYLVVLLY